jgi:hypothetical protein
MAMTMDGKNRIMIYGPKEDGTYVVEFKTAAGEAMAISIPRTEAAVIRHFQVTFKSGCHTDCSCRRCLFKGSLSHGVLARNHCERLDFARVLPECLLSETLRFGPATFQVPFGFGTILPCVG